jgi:hypothetical protein
MGSTRDEFLRRYATSPIHVPRLERLLDVYEGGDQDEAFSGKFIGWDRACPDGDAARIVTEVISMNVDASGQTVRLSDQVVKGAIRWMAEATSYSVADRARILREALSSTDERARTSFIEFLETSGALQDSEFRVVAAVAISQMGS